MADSGKKNGAIIELKVKYIRTTPVLSVTPDTPVQSALDIMLQERKSGLPVVDEGGELVGMISEFDLLILLLQSTEEQRPDARVAEFMTTEVETIDEDASIPDAARRFWTKPIRRLPVVRDGQLVGIITRRDIIRVIRDLRRDADASEWTGDLEAGDTCLMDLV